ncbi:unnamed protein product [Soboliphyme baturini]|uniref:Secreted protein n=1 Tax=Soboliphyme baturini TaxID=241478 RepID=A0A183IKQ3_9BILA|nr:unnamed protein product [Soboliphyme baturini]
MCCAVCFPTGPLAFAMIVLPIPYGRKHVGRKALLSSDLCGMTTDPFWRDIQPTSKDIESSLTLTRWAAAAAAEAAAAQGLARRRNAEEEAVHRLGPRPSSCLLCHLGQRQWATIIATMTTTTITTTDHPSPSGAEPTLTRVS